MAPAARGLIILRVDFKEALRMSAYWANLGSFCADNDMSAVSAFPNLDLALFEYLSCFYIIE